MMHRAAQSLSEIATEPAFRTIDGVSILWKAISEMRTRCYFIGERLADVLKFA